MRIGPCFVVATPKPSVIALPWSSYWQHLVALPFWPCGPLWFLWQLLAFDLTVSVLFQVAPQSGEALARLSSTGAAPGRYFGILVLLSALAYLPLAIIFGATQWKNFGPFALQPDRLLLYVVYFFAGVGIGAYGYQRGLLNVDGMLAQRWWRWSAMAVAMFLLWMTTMAPSFFGYTNALIDVTGYLVVVLAVASACLGFAAVALRFATARWAVADSLADNAYAMYVVHYVFVVWLQYALLGAALPAIAKGTLVFVGALTLSWVTASALRRVPLRAWPSFASPASRE
jgi:acyltransferase-like protein